MWDLLASSDIVRHVCKQKFWWIVDQQYYNIMCRCSCFYTMAEKNQVNICSQIESIPLFCSMSVNPCHLVLIYCRRKSAAPSSDILVHVYLLDRRNMFRQTRAISSQNLDKDQLKTCTSLMSCWMFVSKL